MRVRPRTWLSIRFSRFITDVLAAVCINLYTPTGYVFSRSVLMEQSVPEKYSNKTTEPARPHQGTIYTCPMHPQIRRDAPGNCPICGMALEPVSAAAETGPSPELIDTTRRFWIGTALAVPTVLLEMGAHVPGLNLHHYVSPQISIWLQFLFATPVVLWAGWPFFVRGWASVRNRSLNMFSLIAL